MMRPDGDRRSMVGVTDGDRRSGEDWRVCGLWPHIHEWIQLQRSAHASTGDQYVRPSPDAFRGTFRSIAGYIKGIAHYMTPNTEGKVKV